MPGMRERIYSLATARRSNSRHMRAFVTISFWKEVPFWWDVYIGACTVRVWSGTFEFNQICRV